jgi:hypothetical protein
LPLRGEHDAGASAPLAIAADVAGNLNVFCRVQRRGSFAGKDGF